MARQMSLLIFLYFNISFKNPTFAKNLTMKKILLTTTLLASIFSFTAQQQLGNSGFENWETVSSGEEPVNWNSFLTAGGTLSSFAGDQLESSTDVRPGSTGSKSAKIFSNSVITTIANGNLTVGKINMGSVTPTSTSNYNSSIIADANFSEAYTDTPDSLTFWVKFVPASGNTTDSARVSAIIHDNYALRDPIDAPSQPHVMGTAIKNFAKTDNAWARISVPFTYTMSGTPSFMLITFTTNKTPGGGSDNDQLWIDDIEMKNGSSASLYENSFSSVRISINNQNLTFLNENQEEGTFEIIDLQGKLIQSGNINAAVSIANLSQFIVRVNTNKGSFTKLFTQN